MNAMLRVAIMTRHIAAGKSSVDDMRKKLGRRQHLGRKPLCFRRATRTLRGADIEIGKPSREKARHFGGDRMRVEQDRVSMTRANASDFSGQYGVVRVEINGATCSDLALARCVTVYIQGRVGERP